MSCNRRIAPSVFGWLTVVLVTHDVDMARQTAGRIVKMHYGRIDRDDPAGDAPGIGGGA